MEHYTPDSCNLLRPFCILHGEGLRSLYALEKFTHKPQADVLARVTIGRLRFRSRTLGLVIRNDMDGFTIEDALKPHMPFEMAKLNNICNFNIYSAVCRNEVLNNCPPYMKGMSLVQPPSVFRRLLRKCMGIWY